MKLTILAAMALAMGSLAGWCQDYTELQFHRVHLRNGNFLDGQLVRQSAKEVVIKINVGEMSLRMDLVDHVELVRMKSYNEKPIDLKRPTSEPPVDVTKTPTSPVRPPPILTSKVKLDPQTEEQVGILLDEYFKSDIEMKQAVLGKLISLGGSVPAYLVSIITRFDREQIPVVLSTLVQTKDARLISSLAGHLESADPSLRVNVVMAMGSIGDPSAVSYLRTALKDKDAAVRSAAVTALPLLNTADAFDPLLTMMADPDRETRVRVIGILNDLATKYSQQKQLADAIGAALPRSTGEAQLELIYAAGHGGYQEHWRSLSPLLRDDLPAVRQAAASALADLGAKESLNAVAAAVQTEDKESVQIALAGAAQKLGALQTGGTLIQWLSTGSPKLKAASRAALTSMAGQNHGDDLEKWREWWNKAQPK